MTKCLPSLFAVTFTALIAASAGADPIAITNHSFETPDVATAAQTWSNVNEDWGDDAGESNDQFTEFIEGFVADGLQHAGVNNSDTDTSGAIDPLMQDLAANYMANTLYTLTVAVGNRDTFTPEGNETLLQLADASTGEAVAEAIFDASTIPVGTFEDRMLRYIVGPSADSIGNPIRVQLGVTGPGVGRGHFDNVRLESEPFLFGDFDMDMDVDADDFAVLSGNLAAHLDGATVTYEDGDVDFDEDVDLDDFALFKEAFAAAGALGQGQAIPEPSSVVLVGCMLGALSLAGLRRRARSRT